MCSVIVCWSRRCLDPSFSRHLRFGIALLPEGPAPLRINGDGKGPWCSVFLCVELCWFLPTFLPCVRTFRARLEILTFPFYVTLCHYEWIACSNLWSLHLAGEALLLNLGLGSWQQLLRCPEMLWNCCFKGQRSEGVESKLWLAKFHLFCPCLSRSTWQR